ncbi:MAG: ABC transporter permease [Cyclobacteriaceae bacterium]|nr:ABC transporter permease [Cyclobacteriaceae bacterium]
MKSNPPKLPLRFFRWFCHPKLRDSIEGDLMELYEERLEQSGKFKADLRFIIDVTLLFRPSIIKPTEGTQTLNTYGMYKSYFKIGWRNLLRNKGYSLINIGGLALGMTVAIMIGLWIFDELTYNHYHKNYDRIGQIYRKNLYQGKIETGNILTTGIGTLMRDEYSSHFEKVTMVRGRNEEHVLGFDEKQFTQVGYFMQPDGPEMFSLNMIHGTHGGLADMTSIMLSQSTARKFFNEENPIGQIIRFDNKWDLKITGVYDDLPKNSVFHNATYFAPLDLFLNGWSNLNVWDNYNMHVYVQLANEKNFESASGAIKEAMLPHIDASTAASNPELFVLPMKDWHLNAYFENGVNVRSPLMNSVWYYAIIGCFVLILACINFMNLTTARSEKRSKEVGIRKSIGSVRGQLIGQFYSEAFLVAFLAFILSILLTQIFLPAYNQIADKDMTLPWREPLFWLGGLAFTFITGLLAGSYPALYLSSFNAVQVMKGTFKTGRFASLPRKVLVTVQFTVSISLIIGTAIVYQQIQFAKSRPIGYSREGLISLHPRSPEFQGKYEVLRNELKATGVVDEVAESNYAIVSTLGWNGGFDWRGKDDSQNDLTFNINRVTPEYGKTIGWEFVQGRDFSRTFPADANGVIINETTAKIFGFENPTEEVLIRNRDDNREEYKIVGVIRDVVKGSPFQKTDPCLYFFAGGDEGWLHIRMNNKATAQEALPKIEKAFKKIVPSAPFDFTFADDDYTAKFKAEERIGTLASIFSTLAIIISCLGLFGLASFVAEQRTKEIGIRKVMGASVASLWQMLSKDFVVLVILSFVVAVPLTYSFMNNWLQHYEYRTNIPWFVFVLTGIGALAVTILTVSFQAIKAALTNPVKSLRSE